MKSQLLKTSILTFFLVLGVSACGKESPVIRGDTKVRQYEVFTNDTILASSLVEEAPGSVLTLYVNPEFSLANEVPTLNWSHLPGSTITSLQISKAEKKVLAGKIEVQDMNFGAMVLNGPVIEWRLILGGVKKDIFRARFSPDLSLLEDISILHIQFASVELERWILPHQSLLFEPVSLQGLDGVSATNHENVVNIGILHMGRMSSIEQKKLISILEEIKNDWRTECGVTLEFASAEHLSHLKNVPQLPLRTSIGPDLLGMIRKYSDFNASADILVLSRWSLWSPEQQRIKGAEMKWAEVTLKNYENKPYPHLQSVVLVENLADLAVISHEIGHALLGPAHDNDPGNLMFSKPTVMSLRSEQCAIAREQIAKSF